MTKGNQSKFMSSAEQMKEQLGPAMCLAKWKQVSFHLPTGLNNSCYHPPLHRISIEDIGRDPSALHNTPHKKEQRKLMLAGVKPAECSYCWNMEAHNKLSDRHYRSGEPWAAVDFDKIKNSTGDEDVVPSYVEVNFNNVCAARSSQALGSKKLIGTVHILLWCLITLLSIFLATVSPYQHGNIIPM
jgi:hypothetical protein